MKKILLLLFLFTTFFHTVLAINPIREYKATPANFGLQYQEHKIPTTDGYLLNTWLIEPQKPAAKPYTFVIAYGDAGNMSYQMPYIATLVSRGYTVVAFDYRGFGHSADFKINKDQYYYNEFAIDLISVLNWTKQQKPSQRTAVWAFSMGTIMATLAFEKVPFDFLIGEGFVTSPTNVAARIKAQKGKVLVLPSGAHKVERKIRRIKIPMLLVCAKTDTITTLADSKKIVEGFSNRTILEFDGKHLEGAFVLGLKAYVDEIEKKMN